MARYLCWGRCGLLAAIVVAGNAAALAETRSAQLAPVYWGGAQRWRDIATYPYATDKISVYDYAQATATLEYEGTAPTFTGTLTLSGLKPNFAYQIKLNGKPTYWWGSGGDDWANERLGYAGRWWLNQVMRSTGETVGGWNSDDAEYEYWKARDFTDGTYDYVFEGYVLFTYVVTDSAGNASIDLWLDSSFHVLWKTSQRSPGGNDSTPTLHTVVASSTSEWYSENYTTTDVYIYAEWEPGRALPGECALPPGVYNVRIFLTEESFHESLPDSGEWVTVMAHDNVRLTVPLISAGATWKYDDTGTDLGTAWREPSYDDSGWGEGAAPLGYGDPHIVTTLNNGGASRYPCYYFRRTFAASEAPSTLKVRVLRDDGCVVYINGTEAVRSNMPDGEITYDTWSAAIVGGADETTYFEYDLDPSLVVAGENVVAVEVHQCNSGSSDLGLDLELVANEPVVHDVAVVAIDAPAQAEQGDLVSVGVTVQNQGGAAESFTVTLTDATDATQIGSQQVTDLAPGASTVVSFQWDTASASIQDHTLQAEASTVPDETDTTDNTMTRVVTITELGAVQIIKGPYLQTMTQSSIVVMWETDVAAGSRVDYGTTAPGESTVEDPSPVTIHEVQITGLATGTTYHYTVTSGGTTSAASTFTSAPETLQPFRFVAYGDSRSQPTEHAAVVAGIIASAPAFVVHTGDLVGSGAYNEWGTEFFTPAHDLMIDTPMLPALGNHENNSPWYYDFFSLPGNEQWYAFTYGCARYIALDTNADFSPGSPQYTWLQAELQSTEYTDAIWHFVFFHHPPYTAAGHSDDPAVKAYLVPLFEQRGVDMVFSGHSHAYERYFHNGIYYIVTGGGGAPLYSLGSDTEEPIREVGASVYHHCVIDVSPTTAVFEARENDGTVFDSFTLTKDTTPPVISGVQAIDIGETTATIVWTTDEPADSLVDYGPDINYGSQASDPSLVTSHSIPLTGLSPATTYHYRVTSSDQAGNPASSDDYTFTTLAANEPPAAVDDAYIVDEDVQLSVAETDGVLRNDTDPESDPLTAVLVSDVSYGSLTLNADGSFTYTPAANFNGTDSFTYKANDGKADSNQATVAITVNPVDDPPVATDDSASTIEETPVTIDVLANDSDVDGDTLTVASVIQPANGVVTNNGTDVTYTPNSGFTGTDVFTYTVSDGNGGADTATVTVTVSEINHPPVAADDTYSVDEDVTLTVDAPSVLTNDDDPEDDPLTALLVSTTSNGTLTLNANGSFTYVPNADFNGPDSFTYRANDGQQDSNVATVSITVNAVNDPPGAPHNLSATAGATTVSLDWADNVEPEGDLQGYNVYRSTTSGSYDFVTPLAFVTESAYVDGAVASGTTYYYVVKAVDTGDLESGPSQEASATPDDTLYDAYVGQSPTVTHGSVGGDGIAGTTQAGDGLVQTFTEAPNGRAGRASLQVEYVLHTTANPADVTMLMLYLDATWTDLDGGADPLVVSIWDGSAWQDITADIQGGSFTPTSNPQNYVNASSDIRVLFQDTAPIRKEKKDTLTIDLLYAHVLAGPPDTDPPAPPSGLAATGYDLEAQLSWNPNGEADLAGYRVYRSTTSGGGYELLTPDLVTETAYTDPVGSEGTYYYVVTAVDQSQNESGYSDEASVTLINVAPAPPTGLTATPGDSQVSLQWNANSETDLAGYEVYRSTSQGGAYTRLNSALVTVNSYIDTTAENGTTYYYVVTAVDQAEAESDYSNEVSATPQSQPAVHVENIAMALQQAGKNWRAVATVLIQDQSGAPAAGATVVGDWLLEDKSIQSGASGTTDDTGNAVLTSPLEKAKSGEVFTFRVTDVVLSGYDYKPAQTENSISVP